MSHNDYKYKPRILFISHSGDLYGAERSLLTLLRGMKQLGTYEILVFIPGDGPLSEACDEEDVPFRIIPFERWIGLRYHAAARFYRIIINRLRIGRLVREAERWMPDVIYSNTIATPVGAMLARRLTPAPLHVWHARELPGHRSAGFGLFDYGMKASLSVMARSSDCFICNSRFLHDRLEPGLQRALGSRGALRTEIVYNGLDIVDRASGMAGHPDKDPDSPIRLMMAGGISPVKNYEEAVEAVGILVRSGFSVELDIYGSGADRDQLKLRKKIEDSGLEKHVQLMGYRSNLASGFGRADMLLITSKMETFGRVAVEAMLAGCPVISSDAGALPEIVKDGETGLNYCLGDPEHLARQIRQLAESPVLRKTLMERAHEYARTRFSTERLVSDIDRILQELLAQRNK